LSESSSNEAGTAAEENMLSSDSDETEHNNMSIDENDPVLLESGMILLDALPAFNQSRVAQRR
jgi:hypothetical protein